MYKKIITAFCLFFLSLEARILETDKMADILAEVDEKTVVFLDIDDTLVMRKHMLGSSLWWINCQNYFLKNNVNIDPLIIYSIYQIALEIPISAVDEKAIESINYLQSKGIPVFGLTSRPRSFKHEPNFDLATRNELIQLGIEFSKTDNIKMPHYYEGILFTSGELKGPVLEEFLNQFRKKVKKIIFVDDSWTHVRSVHDCMKKRRIPVVCYRFNAVEKASLAFNPFIANIQLQSMYENKIMLSDEMAQKISETLDETDPNYYLKHLILQTKKE